MGLSTEKFGLDIFFCFSSHPCVFHSTIFYTMSHCCCVPVRRAYESEQMDMIGYSVMQSAFSVCLYAAVTFGQHSCRAPTIRWVWSMRQHTQYLWQMPMHALPVVCLATTAIMYPLICHPVSHFAYKSSEYIHCSRTTRSPATNEGMHAWCEGRWNNKNMNYSFVWWILMCTICSWLCLTLPHTYTHTRSSGCAARLVVHHVQMHFGFDCSTLVVAAHICICITVLLLHHILQFFGWNFVRTVSKQGHVKRAVPCAHG